MEGPISSSEFKPGLVRVRFEAFGVNLAELRAAAWAQACEFFGGWHWREVALIAEQHSAPAIRGGLVWRGEMEAEAHLSDCPVPPR